MQIFIPYQSPIEVARCLDSDRLTAQIRNCTAAVESFRWGKSVKGLEMFKDARSREWLDRFNLCLAHYARGAESTAQWWSKHADLVRPDFITPEYCDAQKRVLYAKAPKKYPEFANI